MLGPFRGIYVADFGSFPSGSELELSSQIPSVDLPCVAYGGEELGGSPPLDAGLGRSLPDEPGADGLGGPDLEWTMKLNQRLLTLEFLLVGAAGCASSSTDRPVVAVADDGEPRDILPSAGEPVGVEDRDGFGADGDGRKGLDFDADHGAFTHRAAAHPCLPVEVSSADATCAPMQEEGGESQRETSQDCPGADICLDTHVWGPSSSCTCHAIECMSDADCGQDELCPCGSVDAARKTCGGWTSISGSNRCILAHCRTDSDCAEGRFCAADPGPCDWGRIEGWYCHDPLRDLCLGPADCPANRFCDYHADQQRWECAHFHKCE